MDFRIASIFLSQLKDPTITLILSIIVGWYGIDRIYLGDVGLGIFKLLTCGGVGIWWLIDLFVISDLARTKNYESLMNL
jgi:TM2 domain-containing membrane protein YozV